MDNQPRNPETRAEPLDALLAAYFRAEMPKHWPPFHAPARTRLAPPAENLQTAAASRWTLLAGALVLVLAVGVLPRPGKSVWEQPAMPRIMPDVAEVPGGMDKGGKPAEPRKRTVPPK